MRSTLPAVLVALCALGAVARADVLVVTSVDDDANDAGSLRAVLARAADGDEVRFDVPGAARLAGDVEVTASALLVRGPAKLRCGESDGFALRIRGDGVQIEKLTFVGPGLDVADGAADTQILGCRFEGRGTRLAVGAALRTRIGSLEQPNRFARLNGSVDGIRTRVTLENDVDTIVEGNRFTGPDASLWTTSSTGLHVTRNRFVDAGVDSFPESAVIEDNAFRLPLHGREGNAILVRETAERAQPGRVEIRGNRMRVGPGNRAIDVSRSDVVVAGNRVRAPYNPERFRRAAAGGVIVGSGHPYHVHDATLVVEDNDISGSDQALWVAVDRGRAGAVAVRGNVVRHVRGVGLAVTMAESGTAVVQENVVARGSGSVGRGAMQVFLASEGGDIAFEGNRVTDGRVPTLVLDLPRGRRP